MADGRESRPLAQHNECVQVRHRSHAGSARTFRYEVRRQVRADPFPVDHRELDGAVIRHQVEQAPKGLQVAALLRAVAQVNHIANVWFHCRWFKLGSSCHQLETGKTLVHAKCKRFCRHSTSFTIRPQIAARMRKRQEILRIVGMAISLRHQRDFRRIRLYSHCNRAHQHHSQKFV